VIGVVVRADGTLAPIETLWKETQNEEGKIPDVLINLSLSNR
jgi:hypothetical protein